MNRNLKARGPHLAGLAMLMLVSAAAVALTSCSANPDEEDSASVALSHIHALVTNRADDSLLAATHEGVFRIEGGAATRVGTGRQDTMGFAARGPDSFYASGHPAPEVGGPSHLGLLVSSDGAKTWTTKSMEGKADFHGLAPTKDGVYGFNSVTSKLMHSADGSTWTDLVGGNFYDIAADPKDSKKLLLTTPEGVQTYDRGSTPQAVPNTVGIALIESTSAETIIGLKTDGQVVTSTDGGQSWTPTGELRQGDIQALGAYEDTIQVATTTGIYTSDDGGKSWKRILEIR